MSDFVIMVATLVIAIFAVVSVVIAAFQYWHAQKTARANYMLALHDKRMEVFNVIDKFLGEFLRDGSPSPEGAILMIAKLRSADFLFPKDVLTIIQELYDQTVQHEYISKKLEPLRQQHEKTLSLNSSQYEEYQVFLKEQLQIESWFREQINSKRLHNDFAPYLKLPPSV